MLGEDERRELERLRQEVVALRAAAAPPHRARRGSLGLAGRRCAPCPGMCGCPGLGARGVDSPPGGRHRPLRCDRESGDRGPAGAVRARQPDQYRSPRLHRCAAARQRGRSTPWPHRVCGRSWWIALHDLTGPLAGGVAGLVRTESGAGGEPASSPRRGTAPFRSPTSRPTPCLSGEAAAISIKGGMVVLDLGPFIDAAKQQLVDSGFTAAGRIPRGPSDGRPVRRTHAGPGPDGLSDAGRRGHLAAVDHRAAAGGRGVSGPAPAAGGAGDRFGRRGRDARAGRGADDRPRTCSSARCPNRVPPPRPPPTTSWCGSC